MESRDARWGSLANESINTPLRLRYSLSVLVLSSFHLLRISICIFVFCKGTPMPKISNTDEYAKLTNATINILDFVIGTQNNTGATKNFPIGSILASVLSAKVIDDISLNEVNSYQNDQLIDANGVWGFFNGEHMNTVNLISNFEPDTGTITFNSDYGPYAGELNILYF